MFGPAKSVRRTFDALPSDVLTLGVEEEFLLVDVDGGALACVGPDLVSALAPDGRSTYELRAAQVETCTPVCVTVRDVERELTDARVALARAAAGLARPLAVPVNPSSSETGPPTGTERYLQIMAGAPWARGAFLACGMHVHVAVGSADQAIVLHDALRSYLPLLAALSANSPIYAGADAGVASARAHLKQFMPRFGVPPSFGSWDRYEQFLRWGSAEGVIGDPSYHWYDLRLNVVHGTIELRVFDVQTEVRHAAALAAVTHALVSWLAARLDDGERLPVHDHHRIHEALWLAARDGADAALPDLDTGILVPVRDQLALLLTRLRPHADTLGCRSELDSIEDVQQQPGHEKQRRIHARNGTAGLLEWLACVTVAPEALAPQADNLPKLSRMYRGESGAPAYGPLPVSSRPLLPAESPA
jgi:carboxylate-amine ligase